MYDDTHQEIRARLTLLNAPQDSHTPDAAYNIYKFTGEEHLGKPYIYEVAFMSPIMLQVEALVDTDVKLFFQDVKNEAKQKTFFGKAHKITHSDSVGDKHLYTFTVVHPLFYLGLNRRYEIFQEQSAFEVIETILERYKGLLDIDFHTNIPPNFFIKREYTTQYKQSDLAFIQMLCEQEGVTLHMETGLKPYKVRLAHINETFSKLATELRCNFNASKAFASTHTHDNYFDFRMPTMNYLQKTGATPLAASLTDNTYSKQLRDALAFETHHDRLEFPRPTNLSGYMKQRSKSNYANTEKIVGESQALEAGIGVGGTLFDTKAIKRTEAIITSIFYDAIFPNALEEYVENIGEIDQYQYAVSFEATPLQAAFIPHYQITKPVIPSSVTALVSDGSERAGLIDKANTIDVDDLGRIRVIFHFDTKYPTSCYIRFANFSSGDGWGSQFIPRVNTEVIVNFLNGDPDRPVAIGSLYNGDNQIPQTLPNNVTQSYIKTQSMPGTASEYNLLLFEDKAGEELVHVRSQKDLKMHALHDSIINIDNNQTEAVGNDEIFNVGHDRTKNIGNDEITDIVNNRTESVGNDESITIGHNQDTVIRYDQSLFVTNSQANKIEKDQITSVGNHRIDDIYGNHSIKTGGHFKYISKGKYNIKAGKHIKSVTPLYQIDASEKCIIKGIAGTVIIDSEGITLKGPVTIKGTLSIQAGFPEGVAMFMAAANEGLPLCIPCLLQEELAGQV